MTLLIGILIGVVITTVIALFLFVWWGSQMFKGF